MWRWRWSVNHGRPVMNIQLQTRRMRRSLSAFVGRPQCRSGTTGSTPFSTNPYLGHERCNVQLSTRCRGCAARGLSSRQLRKQLLPRPVQAHEQVLLADAQRLRRPPRWTALRARAAASRRAARRAARRCAAASRASSSRCSATSSGRGCGHSTAERAVLRRSSSERLAVPALRRTRSTILCFRIAVSQERSAERPAKAARPRQHGLEHVVHHVLGQRRVAQLALREAHQVGAVRDHLGPATRRDRRWRRGRAAVAAAVCMGGSVRAVMRCATVAGAPRASLTEAHSQITFA